MKLTIFKRLVTGNMIMLGFVVFLGGYVVFKLDALQNISKDIVAKETKSLRHCENLADSLISLIMFEQKYFISKDIDYYNKYKELEAQFQDELGLLNEILKASEVKMAAWEVYSQFQNYVMLFDNEVEIIKNQPENYSHSMFLAERENISKKIQILLKRIIRLQDESKDSKLLLSSSMIGEAIKLTLIITVIATALGILISVTNTRAITNSIFMLEQKTREIARGQFNQITAMDAAPKEIVDLARHFNVMCSRLKELEIMKTDFISHFSHELRTPVTSIKEASSMLNMRLFKSDPQKEKELAQLILTECDRLIKSIEKILDLSKMEVFKMEYKFSKANIVNIIRKSLVKFTPAVQNRNIELDLLPAKGIPLTRLDEKRMEEVMNNLISNALKYTPKNGNIRIKADSSKNGDKILVSVTDNGCGIDKKNLERIFEKFKRIDNGNETLRGTGLGLAITKHIIKAHKGAIWAESKVSKGTKISFILPVV